MVHAIPDPKIHRAVRLIGEPSPQKTSDWMRCLVAALTHIAVLRTLNASTLFTAENPNPAIDKDTATVFYPIAPIIDMNIHLFTQPELYAKPPAAWIVLHPPGETTHPDLEEPDSLPLASGTILLPGLPDIGLDHRAAWAAVDTEGQIAHMQYTTHADIHMNADLAVLAALSQP